jgi:uncharacterized protein (DUF2126 family)
VNHEGGRHYLTVPVDAHDAESRRKERFTIQGHSHGWMIPKEPIIYPDYPCTLDLRMCLVS